MKIVKQLALFLENKPGTLGAMVLRVDNLKKAARILKGR